MKNKKFISKTKSIYIKNSPWSRILQQQTRQAIEDLCIGPDGLMHFKHKELGYATISFANICSNHFLLQVEPDGKQYEFSDIDELLADGWAID
jgi:hypothetical protein